MVKFAVIGCGNIAQKSSIPALMKSGVSSVSVCVDVDWEKKKVINDNFDLPFATSLSEAIKNFDFEAVYISTPIGTHKQLIIKAAQNKKNILCEKSLAVNLEEVEEIVSVCKENNVALFEGFMYQFHTQHKFVRNLIKNGEIGEPIHFQAWFGFPPLRENDFRYNKKLGGGAVLDAGSYTIHAARHIFNEEPIEVFSSLRYDDKKEVEIGGSGLFKFGNGRTAHIAFGFNNMYQNKYTIWGSEGIISLERAFALPPDFKSKLLLEKQGTRKEFVMTPCDHFVEEINHFVENINNDEMRTFWNIEILDQSKSINKLFS